MEAAHAPGSGHLGDFLPDLSDPNLSESDSEVVNSSDNSDPSSEQLSPNPDLPAHRDVDVACGTDVAAAINALLGWHVGKRSELKILRLLTEAHDLNALLPKIKAKVLFKAFRDHRFRQAPNKSNLYRLLGKVRIGELNVESKVIIISSICRKSKPDVEDQKFILELFKSTKGMDFHNLKHQLDQYSHYSNLSDVNERVFNDDALRQDLEAYVKQEATALLQDPSFKRDVHALSDIDDTFVHSPYGLGGPKYPKGCVLPGVVTLFTCVKAHVVFVTARPRSTRGLTYRHLKKLSGVKNLSVLTGKLRDSVLIPFQPTVANEMICDRKVGNFLRHKRMFPECQFLWFGDSGQSDADVGVRLMQEESVLGAYIQDVARKDGIILATSDKEREIYFRKGVQIVDNYVDVALRMHGAGLLTDEGLRDTALDAVVHLTYIRPQFEDPRVFEARARELQVNLHDVNMILQRNGMAPVHMGFTLPSP